MGFFGDLINAVVGAVAAFANAVIDELAPVVEGGGAMGEIAGDISEGAEAVLAATSDYADANDDGEIDDEDAEEILENAYRLLVGAFITKFGSDSSGSDDCSVSSWGDDSESYISDFISPNKVTDGAAVTFDKNGYSEPKSAWDCITGLKNYVEDKASDAYTATKNAFSYMAECYQEGEENREKTEELIQESNNKLVNDAINFYKYSNEINEEAQRQSDEIERQGNEQIFNWLRGVKPTSKYEIKKSAVDEYLAGDDKSDLNLKARGPKYEAKAEAKALLYDEKKLSPKLRIGAEEKYKSVEIAGEVKQIGNNYLGGAVEGSGSMGSENLEANLLIGKDEKTGKFDACVKGKAIATLAEGTLNEKIYILGLEVNIEETGYVGGIGVEGTLGIDQGKVKTKLGACALIGGSVSVSVGLA
ncbi:hypothetical protein [Clostridium saccharoperbutylacetonicum]|uniref:hypothetical protein n=1 Tax=Clostridium saccharoperbutylacetonicum TaxID=36745 RepID=UPI0009840700|nr:hypothetical protein [Clostridium saccharoperbutylacetonicum]AQR93135.1 hypothetical protein CLSAP_04120 [Clostridium saccharoperbutylacetonicum]NSB34547.1 hypothetical protein [Clostridium saccharoperbutylacetonicum]